jgi:hypothetical protein
MQMTGKGGEMVAAMLAFAIRGIAVEHGGRRGARMGPLVAQINPEAAGLGFAVAGSKNRNGRVVGVDDAASHDVSADPFGERLH